ncbi:MAG: transposase [Nitrososphaerota archaeon]|nr:transposase [Nitrososphaerota archaeon]MDG6931120.1 transposase [Nitrososphaerota archaeon]
MVFIRRIKKPSGIYLALVESRWENGKPRQHVIKYLGKEVEGKPVKKVVNSNISVTEVKKHLDVEIIDKLASDLGIKDFAPKGAMVMVYSQLLDRPSINRMEEWLKGTDILETLGIDRITTARLYNALEELGAMDFTRVEGAIREMAVENEEMKSLIIDVTDTYFKGESMEDEPRRGKDGKVRKLLQISMAVTERNGFPIFHKIYDGNISSKRMFTDMLATLEKSGYKGVIMDRGFYSQKNLNGVLSLNLKVICGVVKDRSFRPMLDRLDVGSIYTRKNMVKLRNTTVYCKAINYMKGRLIEVYNPYLEAIRREHYYESNSDESAAKLLGYSLIYHNTDMKDEDVVRKYFEKDAVERSFRKMKGIISLRPVRVWLRSHVEAHVRICYMAYAILSLLEYRISGLGMSGTEALETLSTGYRVMLTDRESGLKWDALVELSKKQSDIRNLVYKNG